MGRSAPQTNLGSIEMTKLKFSNSLTCFGEGVVSDESVHHLESQRLSVYFSPGPFIRAGGGCLKISMKNGALLHQMNI